MKFDGYSSTGHTRPCEDWSYSWDKLTTAFTSNLTTDQGININITTSISGGLNEGEFSTYPTPTNCARPAASKYFIFWVHSQVFYGFTDDNNIPKIQNFNFRPNIKLEGKLFQNINYNSLTSNSETNCPAPPSSNAGIDSVYYSTQNGLIRLTTVGGKKYQRIL